MKYEGRRKEGGRREEKTYREANQVKVRWASPLFHTTVYIHFPFHNLTHSPHSDPLQKTNDQSQFYVRAILGEKISTAASRIVY